MSSRALKKLIRLHESEEVNADSDESSEEEIAPCNNFNLLQHAISSDEADEEKVSSEEEAKPKVQVNSSARKKKNKRKGKKAKAKNIATEDEEDEVERCLREVNAMLGEAPAAVGGSDGSEAYDTNKSRLLCIDCKHLNPANEMRRKFGAKVVNEEQRENKKWKRQPHASARRTPNSIVSVEIDPRLVNLPAMSMEKVEKRGKYTVFKYQHHKSYQKIQAEFMLLSKSLDPNTLRNFTARYPYHIDTLLQVSEMFRQMEDSLVASRLIENCLYVHQSLFHENFSISSGTCIMDYKHKENRGFFIALFRHANFMNDKGCYRTALELTKLLLSLAPEEDPLATSLVLDYYALVSREYAWLYRLYKEYNPLKNLSWLPNFAFSVPLALFHLSSKKSPKIFKEIGLSAEECKAKANKMLQDALLKFPGLLPMLLDKCSVRPDSAVSGHAFFGVAAVDKMSKPLQHLVKLYVYRNFYEWKQPTVVKWLEENCRKTLERVDKCDPFVEICKERREKSFQGMPLAIYRHLFLAEVKDLSFPLPPHATNTGVMSYDPLPPPDSICDYSLTNSSTPGSANVQSGVNIVETFVRSLLPDYNPEEPNQQDVNQGEIQERMRAFMDSLRQLFTGVGGESAHEGDDDGTN